MRPIASDVTPRAHHSDQRLARQASRGPSSTTALNFPAGEADGKPLSLTNWDRLGLASPRVGISSLRPSEGKPPADLENQIRIRRIQCRLK